MPRTVVAWLPRGLACHVAYIKLSLPEVIGIAAAAIGSTGGVPHFTAGLNTVLDVVATATISDCRLDLRLTSRRHSALHRFRRLSGLRGSPIHILPA